MKAISGRRLPTKSRCLARVMTLGAASAMSICANAATTLPVINEFSASTAGTDVEYVEIHGLPSTDYGAYSVLEIEGDSTGAGVVDEVISLGVTDANGLYLVSLPANALENGTITLLLVQGFTGALNNDLDTDNDGVLDVTPWTAVIDAVAVNDGGSGDRTYGVPALAVAYDGLSFAPGGASRIPDGLDTDLATDWVRNDFDLAGIPGFPGTIVLGEAYNTPGALNVQYVPPPPEACGDAYTLINQIQGAGSTSPLVGTELSTEGVVIGDFQSAGLGFYVQEVAATDADPATSEGLSIFGGSTDVNVGDRVRVRGQVVEFNELTQLSAGQIWVCSTNNSLPTPAPLSLPVMELNDFEPYEGMLVTIPQTLYISEFVNFDRFGEIVLTTDRQYQPTAIYEPGSQDAADLAALNQLARITLDDGRNAQNPDPACHPNGSEFLLTNLFRGGDTVTNVTGVLDYRFGLYRIQPTQGATYSSENSRTLQPEDVGGALKVASLNTLNYFTTIDYGVLECGPLEDQECRGADSLEEFERQQDKLIAALASVDADVVGLIEMENHPEDVPAATLVDALNDAVGAGTYSYVETGAIGPDAIRQALIYKSGSVAPLGDYAVLDSTVDIRFLDTYNRPALAQTFRDSSTGGVFTVAVNHLKSKGSPCDAVGDPDTGDGAGNCNLTRKAAAEALVDWLASDPTGSGDDDFLIIGDLNSYDKEDPIDVLAGAGYTDLLSYFVGEGAYTYLFDGQLGYLDYALAGTDLMNEVAGTSAWHINADEPDLIDYDMTFKQDAQAAIYAPDAYRSSDHDPVVVGLSVCDEIAPTITVALSPNVLWPANHMYVDVNAFVGASDNFDSSPVVELVSVLSSEPDNGSDDGNTVNDIIIIDETTFQLRAERSGTGPGRTYTVVYQATDSCGNSTLGAATALVPLSLGQ